MKLKALLVSALIFSWHFCQATLEFNQQLSDVYGHIIRLDLDKGHKLLLEEQAKNPVNNLTLLYENYIDFLKAFISEERSQFEQFEKNYSHRYSKILNEKSDSPWKLYSLAEMKMQEVFLKIKFSEFKSAVWGMRSAYKMLEKNNKLFPSFILTKKNLGMIHVVIGSVPSDYRWLVKLGGLRGTVPQGMKELNDALSSLRKSEYHVYEEEFLFYISTIQTSLSVPPAEMKKTAEIIKPFAAVNPLMNYCYINLRTRSGQSKLALEIQDEHPDSKYPFHFLNYKKGMLLLFKLDPGAEKYFNLFLENYSGMNFIKSAYQKLAWIYLLKDDMKRYMYYMGLAKQKGAAFVDDDKQAARESKNGEVPNLVLLKSRLLYDGGYYDEALAEFRNVSMKDFQRYKDQLEMTYRLARIYQSLGKNETAMNLYRKTIKNGELSSYYFAANSSLLLGNHFENNNQRDSASLYYRKCLEMKRHEYQNSIDQKARAGLERLGME